MFSKEKLKSKAVHFLDPPAILKFHSLISVYLYFYDPDLEEPQGEGHRFPEGYRVSRHDGGRQDVTIDEGGVALGRHQFVHVLVDKYNHFSDP